MSARLAALSLLALSACDFLDQLRDPESDPPPLEPVAYDAFEGDGQMIVGGGASPYVAYTRWSSTNGMYGTSVRLVRLDEANPDQLQVLADVDAGAVLGMDGNLAILRVPEGVAVVDLATPELTTRTVPTASGAERASATGRWLLTGYGPELLLFDVAAPAAVAAFTASAPVTSLVAIGGEFLAFTSTGYVHVTPDPVAPTWTATTSAVLRNFRAAFADGAGAVVAGPSLALGASRILRLALASPPEPSASPQPVVRTSHELPVPYAFFAWDGGTLSVLATGDGSATVTEGYAVHELDGAFREAGIPLPIWWRDANPIAAHAGRLFALSFEGLGLYRIQR